METILGYTHAKEEIKEGDLLCITVSDKGEFIVTMCDDRIFTNNK